MMSDTPFPAVGIGILNWNGLQYLKQLLPRLERLTYPNYHVYLIDNNSSDSSVTFANEHFPNVTLIALDDNYGFAGGYNRGFVHMPESFWLMMNSDVDVPANFIEPLINEMLADEQIALVQPKMKSLLNPHQLEHAGAAGGMMDFLGYPFCRGRLFNSCEEDEGQFEEPSEIFWATGACCLIRSAAYKQVGGMYDYYFMHSEEIDLCWRLRSMDYKICYCPSSFIYHLGGGTLSYHTPRKTYFNFRNNIIMCFRNSPWYINLWLMPLRLILDFIASMHFLLNKDSINCKAVFKAYRDAFKWLFQQKDKYPAKKRSLLSMNVVLKKSVVWEYYIRHVRDYRALNN